MKINGVKKVLILIIGAILINTIFVNLAYSFGIETHKAINGFLVDENSAIFGNYFHNYLKNEIGMQDGVKTIFNSKMAKEWIAYGGAKEDSGFRSVNHFHNPLTNKGLSPNYSALTWATLLQEQQNLSLLSSWNDVRYYYERALTDKDKTEREKWFALTFQGVGQIMHLMEDMSVPAHTRNSKCHFKLETSSEV